MDITKNDNTIVLSFEVGIKYSSTSATPKSSAATEEPHMCPKLKAQLSPAAFSLTFIRFFVHGQQNIVQDL